MEGEQNPDDPFGVQLEWPEEQLGKPFEPPMREAAAAPVEDPAPSFAPPSPSPLLDPPRGVPTALVEPPHEVEGPVHLDDAPMLLAKAVARIDVLIATTTTYRNALSDKVSEYTDGLHGVIADVVAQGERDRRVTEQAVTGLGGETRATRELLERVLTTVESVSRQVSELGSQLDRVSEEVQTLRRRTAVRSRAAPEATETAVRRAPRRGSTTQR